MKFTSLLLLFLCTPYAVNAIKVKTVMYLPGTDQQKAFTLANEIAGPGVIVKNAQFESCSDEQIGLFTDAGDQLGTSFVNGIVLSSGSAADVMGVSDNKYTTDSFNHLGFAGLDAVLKASGGETKDACVFHITFLCEDDDQFRMKFVFGSDNYDCPVHTPYYTPYEDVMGIFIGDAKTNGASTNIGRINGKYVSVNTFNAGTAPKNYVDNCNGKLGTEMNGYSNPITIKNDMNKVKTGQNELWLAVADGFDASTPNNQNNVKKPSFLFVRRNSLVCQEPVQRNLRGTPE